MGLDAYFYIKPKVEETPKPVSLDLLKSVFSESERLRHALTELYEFTENKECFSFESALCEAIESFTQSHIGSESLCNEILYFRKFHYLLSYFNYGDDEYGKDMEITKEQCEELLNQAKCCLKAVDKYVSKQPCSVSRDDDGVLLNYFVTTQNNKIKTRIDVHVNNIANKWFPCNVWNDSYIDHVSRLFTGMKSILKTVDWGTESLVFNADW